MPRSRRPVRACVFDLFGTLVPVSLTEEYYAKLRVTARTVGAPEEPFVTHWQATYRERNDGTLATLEENVIEVCRRLDMRPAGDAVTRGLEPFRAVIAQTMRPKPESVGVLTEIRERGYALGLISNCNPDVPILFRRGPLARFFRHAFFSSDVGMVKPDPAVYLEMSRRLGVDPRECLYIGDGHAKELTGASGVGMTTVLVDYTLPGGFVWERDEQADHRVQDLREILPILDRLGGPLTAGY